MTTHSRRSNTLIFTPTYNERDNVENMFRQLRKLSLDADFLFVDDNSPDGTGIILDRLAQEEPRLHVLHRAGKLGIGTAHIAGINWAYDHGYERIVTMDCDFTHTPSDIPRLLENLNAHDVVVGSRYMAQGSLPGWNLFRRTLTHLGHALTRVLLKMPQDATGGFRAYNLNKIPKLLFKNVVSPGYSFFFESLFLIKQNGYSIGEIPIVLPARTYGHSKMSSFEAAHSALRVLHLYLETRYNPGQFRVTESFSAIDESLSDPQDWDVYWEKKSRTSNLAYDIVATLYRNIVIKRQLQYFLSRVFPPGSYLLHAGCGSGQVDAGIHRSMRVTAADISVSALKLYYRNNPDAYHIKHCDILSLPFEDQSYDGVYNLGVCEHFTPAELVAILSAFRRVLKKDGKLLLFWPHAYASSVVFLRLVHYVLNDVLTKSVQLHPPEPTLLQSRRMAERLLGQAGFRLIEYHFGPRDMYVQVVLVAEPLPD